MEGLNQNRWLSQSGADRGGEGGAGLGPTQSLPDLQVELREAGGGLRRVPAAAHHGQAAGLAQRLVPEVNVQQRLDRVVRLAAEDVESISPEDLDLCECGAEVSGPQRFEERLDGGLRVGRGGVRHAHVLLAVGSRLGLLQAALQGAELLGHVGHLRNEQTFISLQNEPRDDELHAVTRRCPLEVIRFHEALIELDGEAEIDLKGTVTLSELRVPWRSHLGLPLDGVHPADELAVGLEQQQQLEVQLVEPAAQLQLLEAETQQSSTPRTKLVQDPVGVPHSHFNHIV
ncbi:hypothetical protein EYF80_051570 [Liparis tanakae]|uniref:Uncharacterized protein n=1 Tax=Liparis tanakae TaxID=230148 RepID=A0A4Z2FAK5_9TELE|nr:hypothetical protein EYF80_051570 [Liparis tanakae]